MRRSLQVEGAEEIVESYPDKLDGRESIDLDEAPESQPMRDEYLTVEDDDQPQLPWAKMAIVSLALIACLIRLVAADRLTPWVDEPVSMLAAFEVADRGVPILPSGKLYLQGATLSYILAPVVLAGYDELDDLAVLRLSGVIAGTLAVIAFFFLARDATGSTLGGFLAGLFLALEPSSVRWSSYVRMYALLQLCTIVVVWLFLGALLGTASRRRLIAMVGVFWFGVFTHVAIVLIWPPMALCALFVCGRSLINRCRALALALGACMTAPVVFVILNRLVKPAGLAAEEAAPDADFVGSHLISIQRFFHPSIDSWLLLFRGATFYEVIPALVFGASCLLAGRYFMSAPNGHGARTRRRLLSVVLLLYWLPITIVGVVATVPQARYLIHIHPFGYLIITILILDLAFGWRAPCVSGSRSRNLADRQNFTPVANAIAGLTRAETSPNDTQ
jgi:hypothetical protein